MVMNQHKVWSEDEDRILKENYLSMTMKKIKEFLPDRSETAIQQRASKFDLKKRSFVREIWSKEEEEILRLKYPISTMDDLLQLLPRRNKNKIKNKARQMRLTKSISKWKLDEVVLDESKLTDYEIGYLAGFFDADGSVSISQPKGRAPRPDFVWCNTHKPTIDKIAMLLERIGAKPKIYTQKTKGGRKTMYNVRLNGLSEIRQVIKMLYPYLIVKKEKAKEAFDLIVRKSDKNLDYIAEEAIKLQEKLEFVWGGFIIGDNEQ